MRTKNAKTQVECWDCCVSVDDKTIFEGRFKTLRDVACEIGFSYHQVVEISNNRKKQGKGKYDAKYTITRITKEPENPPESLFAESSLVPVLSLKTA